MTLSTAVVQAIDRGAGARRIGFVVIHTCGDGRNRDASAAAIRAYHMAPKPRGRGWSDIGYNFWIRMSGLVEMGRPLARVPAHATGFNVNSYGIGLAGDGDLSDFTLAQYDALFEMCWALQARESIPFDHFIGHREVQRFGAPNPRKTCPGMKVDLDRFRAMLAEPR